MGVPVVISLVNRPTPTANDGGDVVGALTTRQVMADRMSVRQSEYYQAQAAGLRAEIMFRVMAVEYQGERWLTHAGQTYSIIRTYERPDERIELICQGLAVS